MLDWTDRHDRWFLRQISRHALLYTEMVTTGAILFGDRDRHLAHSEAEHPLALQLGGSDPAALAECAGIAADYGYDEINLNIGCPSDRVQNGAFGACLMATPQVVAECVAAMVAATEVPVTVKHRIGIDDQDDYRSLEEFVDTVAAAGCRTFIVHARKAWLKGLSPKENRDIPPLNYARVYQLKREHPELEIIINGGIKTLEACDRHLQQVDGVMLGREIYHNPFLLAQVDSRYYNDDHPIPDRHQIVARLLPYIEEQLSNDIHLSHITRHILGLFHGQPGARSWRRVLSERAPRKGAGLEVVEAAWNEVRP
jgi:tRNA-dihydrouridine synthase A